MSKPSPLWMSTSVLTAAIAVASLATVSSACGAGEAYRSEREPGAEAAHHHAHHHESFAGSGASDVAAGALSGHSVYHLDSVWWDQHGESRTLESLAGRVQVVAMVYTYCSYTCPRILTDMKRIESESAGAGADGVGFTLVSIDPLRDTPERLGAFATATRLDPERWTLLSGSDDSILELATVLGIRFRREGESEFAHTNAILVLDRQGAVLYRQDGLGVDPRPLIDAIRGVVSEE
jgi:protein SCO1